MNGVCNSKTSVVASTGSCAEKNIIFLSLNHDHDCSVPVDYRPNLYINTSSVAIRSTR